MRDNFVIGEREARQSEIVADMFDTIERLMKQAELAGMTIDVRLRPACRKALNDQHGQHDDGGMA